MSARVRDRRELFANTIAAWTWSQGTLAASVIALPLLTRFLSKDEFGLWTQLLSLSAFATVADAGMIAVFLRRMTGDADADRASILQSATVFYRVSSAVLTASLLLVSLVPGGLLSPYASHTKMPVLTALLVITTMGVNLRTQPFALRLLSRGRIDLAQIFGAGPAITGTLVSIVAAYWFGTAVAVAIGYAAVETAFDVGLVFVARRYWARGRIEPVARHGLARWGRLLHESTGVLVINSVPLVSTAIGMAVVGHVAGPTAAAMYGVASKAASLVPRSFAPFIQSLFVSLCRATRAARPVIARLAAQLSVVTLAGGATVAFIMVAVGADGMRTVFGSGYGRGVWAALVLVLAETIRGMYQPFLRKIQSENAIGSLRYWFIVSMAAQVPLTIVAAERWSVVGVAVAVLACAAVFEAVPTARKLSAWQRLDGADSEPVLRQACAVIMAGCFALLLAWGRHRLGTVAIGLSAVFAITTGLLTLRQVARYLAVARTVTNSLLVSGPGNQEA